MRGRLAEADVLLACLITWAIVAFDRMIADDDATAAGWRRARWAFFVLLGLTSLVKGIGFGAVLILAVVAVAILWRRDGAAMRRLMFPAGAIGGAVAVDRLADARWSCGMVPVRWRSGRCTWPTAWPPIRPRSPASPGGSTRSGLLIQAMPWTPLACVGAWHSLRRAVAGGRGGGGRIGVPASVVAGDRLLWAWSAAPLALLSLATVKNAHYAIAAQVPWSIWAALGLSRLSGPAPPPRLDARSAATCRGRRLRRAGAGLRPGLLAAGPAARPPGRRVGLLRVGRPLAPARRARDAPLRRLGPQPV